MSLKKFIESKPSHIQSNEEESGIILKTDLDVFISEYNNGVAIADSCGIPFLKDRFSWKRGFQNVFTGYPNDGKTMFALFCMLFKGVKDGWKWVVWSPEMRSSAFVNGKVRVNYHDLLNEMIWTLAGKTPYKHIADKYFAERLTLDEVMYYLDIVQQHFITINPKDRTPEAIYTELKRIYEDQGFDGVLIDPFKNLEHDIRVRDDIYLDRVFSMYKDFAIETNSVMNWIAHPKANVQRLNADGTLKYCDQYMLNGGAAWDNNMDGIYSVFRPNRLVKMSDPDVWFLNLKQKKQALTTERGVVDNITFDIKKYRYLFGGIDPFM